jgi:hypothetical protein
MLQNMNAEFRCVRNDDGTCQGQVTVNGEQFGAKWCVQRGTPADLQGLYLNFVVEHMVCPTIQKPCQGCLPPEFIAKIKELVEGSEGDSD